MVLALTISSGQGCWSKAQPGWRQQGLWRTSVPHTTLHRLLACSCMVAAGAHPPAQLPSQWWARESQVPEEAWNGAIRLTSTKATMATISQPEYCMLRSSARWQKILESRVFSTFTISLAGGRRHCQA